MKISCVKMHMENTMRRWLGGGTLREDNGASCLFPDPLMLPVLSRVEGSLSKHNPLLYIFFFIHLLSLPLLATDGALILERANSNENTYSGGEFVSYLRGNVVFLYDDIRIRADEATWWKNQGVVSFRNRVRVVRKGQLMTCDKLHFTRERNLITASGKFFFIDSAQTTTLSGNEAEYTLDKKDFFVRGNPMLVRKDSTETDTLFISGKVMTYTDSAKMATVTDNVHIRKGSLSATSKKTEFFTEDNIAKLRISPEVYYENHRVVGDSVDLYFGDESLKSARVIGNSHGRYAESSGSKGDTTITHIWSDSLHLTVSDSGKLDSLYAFGRVLSRYFAKGDSARSNEASGRTMVLSFRDGGKVDRANIKGNAKSIYYIQEADGSGRNEASGDQIIVTFELGRARLLRVRGSTRGRYIPL